MSKIRLGEFCVYFRSVKNERKKKEFSKKQIIREFFGDVSTRLFNA